MSKKIIYLLSLLMALSLVFASCKKNNPLNSLNELPRQDTEFTTDDENGFLTQDELQEYASKFVEDKAVLSGNANEFSRNPVIAVMGTKKDTVLIVAERRYDSPGSINDIGLDGSVKTDLYYVVGTKSGTVMGTPAAVGAKANSATTSHAAPVLFKINDTDVIIVASTGAGISRTSQAYNSRQVKSGLEYIAGKLNGATMQWGNWTELKITDSEAKTVANYISGTTDVNNLGKPQFGTHSARGHVNSGGTLALPIVLADQGTSSQTHEKMAILFLTGTVNSSGKDATVTWKPANSHKTVKFTEKGNYSRFKESRIIGGTEGNYKYLVVPSPSYGERKLGIGSAGTVSATGYVNAGEGSMGYLTLQNGWYGETPYDPQNYNASSQNQGVTLFSHVTSAETDMKLYVYNAADANLTGAPQHTLTIVNKGKSSSIDILGDGTIVTVAEEGLRAGSTKRNDFVVRFSRYTQNYLSTVTAKK